MSRWWYMDGLPTADHHAPPPRNQVGNPRRHAWRWRLVVCRNVNGRARPANVLTPPTQTHTLSDAVPPYHHLTPYLSTTTHHPPSYSRRPSPQMSWRQAPRGWPRPGTRRRSLGTCRRAEGMPSEYKHQPAPNKHGYYVECATRRVQVQSGMELKTTFWNSRNRRGIRMGHNFR